MQQRVTAILVAQSGAAYLGRTLDALAAQTRLPDAVIAVDLESPDGSAALLSASSVTVLVSAPAAATFGQGVALAVTAATHIEGQATARQSAAAPVGVASPEQTPDADAEWLWLLAHDSAPRPDALEHLLGAVEIAPSVAIAGPKLTIWDQPRVIAEFGETMTRFGSSLAIVDHELDQAQHDAQNDVLGVAATGMLVRRSVWTALGGFDRGLPSTDAALDFCIRARLAGHRVVTVPTARVASAGAAADFSRTKLTPGRDRRISRSAQLHRRLVYAPSVVVPLHWLALVPLAFLRVLLHLLAKRPRFIGAEILAAFAVAFSDTSVLGARRRLRRTQTFGWKAVAPLRLSTRRAWEFRAQRHENGHLPTASAVVDEPVGFILGGGLWAMGGAAALGVLAFGRLIGAASVTGGGLLPLSPAVTGLWENLGWGGRALGAGAIGAADPFTYLLAVLGSLTFWQPSLSIVLLYLTALPLAVVGAFFCARRLTTVTWVPALAGFLWSIAPSFISGLQGGHLGAAVAHLLLPWLVLLSVNGVRSWSAAAGSGLVFAAVVAGAPVLAPALLLLWFGWLISHPWSWLRLAAIPVPALALYFPLIIDQWMRSNLIGLLADPGVAVINPAGSGLQLALGSAAGRSDGWTGLLSSLSLPGSLGPVVVAVLLLPLGALALLALFTRGAPRAIPPLIIALLGFVTAAAASRLFVTSVGASANPIWAGSGLSLFWLGLIGSALVSLQGLPRRAPSRGVLLGVASVLLAIPLISAAFGGVNVVQPGTGRSLPAIVSAETTSRPRIGTLVLRPSGADAVTASLERGTGATLDDQSTLISSAPVFSAVDLRLATLAGNLASRSGYDPAAELSSLSIDFLLLAPPISDGTESDGMSQRIRHSLDGNERFISVGETSKGSLWRFTGQTITAAPGVGNRDTAYGQLVLGIQVIIMAVTTLLAIPTGRSARRRRPKAEQLSGPAATFDEDTDD